MGRLVYWACYGIGWLVGSFVRVLKAARCGLDDGADAGEGI
jgi:hypothetical protein